jgi:hypothetical protein
MTEIETYKPKVPEYTKRAILKYYHKQYTTNEEFRTKHIERSQNYYKNNNDLCKVKRRYKYWQNKGDLEKYKNKYPDDMTLKSNKLKMRIVKLIFVEKVDVYMVLEQ